MNEEDHVVMWLLLVILIVTGLAITLYINAERIVDAAYYASTPIKEIMK